MEEIIRIRPSGRGNSLDINGARSSAVWLKDFFPFEVDYIRFECVLSGSLSMWVNKYVRQLINEWLEEVQSF